MKTSKLLATLATLTLALGLSFSTASLAQVADKLPNCVPVLPRIKARALAAELKKGQWHSPEGDLLIYLPRRKFLMAIDTLAGRPR